MAGVHHAMSGAAATALGVKTLKEVVFNASGNFVVPSDAIDNKFYVGCTGGGGGGGFAGVYGGWDGGAGGGSGRVSAALTLAPGSNVPVTVGAGAGYIGYARGGTGGTSSFGVAVSCAGGIGGYSTSVGGGVSGGGSGGYKAAGGASNCPAMFTLEPGTVDNTNKFYTAKSYAGGTVVSQYVIGGESGNYISYAPGGGAGCYGHGCNGQWAAPAVVPNSGSGATCYPGGGENGKVVIYYYVYE